MNSWADMNCGWPKEVEHFLVISDIFTLGEKERSGEQLSWQKLMARFGPPMSVEAHPLGWIVICSSISVAFHPVYLLTLRWAEECP